MHVEVTRFFRMISLFLQLLKARRDLVPGKIPILGTGNWFGCDVKAARCEACARPVKEGKAHYHISKQQNGNLDMVAFDATMKGIWGVIR